MKFRIHTLASMLCVLASVACGASPSAPASTAGGGAPPPATRPSLDPAYRPSGHMAAGDVFVQLFEWKWTDIASECEQVLGPVGYRAVQISPPQEHSITPTFDWSERYQPVSYTLAHSRSGDSTQFVDMVRRCKAAGVDIYVDAVINHMTNSPSPGVGSAGTAYSKYDYPGLYTPADFHPTCLVTDYSNAANVQDCELLGLPDLNTSLPYVQHTLADYLIKLVRLGVAGFRIDAAKHIQQVELDDILTIVDSTVKADGLPVPYYFLEVSTGPGEALGPRDYYGEGYRSGAAADITEFIFQGVGDKFLGTGGQHLSQLDPNGPPGSQFSATAWGMMPSDKAVVFLENHDTQHDVGRISYRDGQTFRLANVWMLAQPYGYPVILSSYAFSRPVQNSMGPPSDANGNTNDVTCAPSLEQAVIGEWVCEHRDPMIEAMVGFRRAVAGTAITDWWDDGANAIAFSRGARGFVAISRESGAVDTTVATTMPPGNYCDLLSGGLRNGACAGTAVAVDSTGTVHFHLTANSAIAIDADSRR
ncbi:MAG: alpha-amylase family protein [Gemmatimonadota bacterium]|nr:alpha-amylase family protein [Gemmatimonadota bacterium]MDE3214829.1 alpha-amylase family protein [Gemmatimonadota bacterium]